MKGGDEGNELAPFLGRGGERRGGRGGGFGLGWVGLVVGTLVLCVREEKE